MKTFNDQWAALSPWLVQEKCIGNVDVDDVVVGVSVTLLLAELLLNRDL